jgi:hypothetical protein
MRGYEIVAEALDGALYDVPNPHEGQRTDIQPLALGSHGSMALDSPAARGPGGGDRMEPRLGSVDCYAPPNFAYLLGAYVSGGHR